MNTSPVYLDFAATTPIHKRVAKAMSDFLFDPNSFGNPSSDTHSFGHSAQSVVQKSREDMGELLNCKPRNLLFTSGATESNNLIIQGIFSSLLKTTPAEDIHFITSTIEHKSVLETFKKCEQKGADVTYLYPNEDGLITPEILTKAITEKTKFVSLMYVNNEIGNITDVNACAQLCKEKGILFHTDASQAVGKLKIDLANTDIDLLSFSAHKFYGPKGVGGFYFSHAAKKMITPLFFGGPQERGLRPGTIPTHQLVGLAAAARLAIDVIENRQEKAELLRQMLISRLDDADTRYAFNTNLEQSLPGIVNIHFKDADSDLLMLSLSDKMAVSTGSACNSQEKAGSYVLNALHRKDTDNNGAHLRISFGDTTTPNALLSALDEILSILDEMKELA